MTSVQTQRQPSAAAQARLFHFYVPWSLLSGGSVPPVGARALCGTVYGGHAGVVFGFDHPAACVVCESLSRSL